MSFILLAQGDGGFADIATRLWEETLVFLRTEGLNLALNILAAFAIFLIGRWAVGLVHNLLVRTFTRARVDETLAKFLANIVYAIGLTLVIVAAISRLGVDTTSFAAVLAAAGLAVGLALQSSLSNFAAGVMIILFRPFKVGDYIETGGTAGIVEEIHIFNTWMRTLDNRQVVLPNGSITSGVITNFSAKPTRRIDLEVNCGYQDDLRAVKKFLEELVQADERILKEPSPLVAVDQLGDVNVRFVARPWVKREDFLDVRFALIERIKLGFDEHGFSMPAPPRIVYPDAERTEKSE
jgi:small conductance mechanosensitive channel